MGLLSDRSDDDEPGEVTLGDLAGLEQPGELVYELDDWSDRDVGVLRERLAALAVPHRFEDRSLVVAEEDEAWVERVMDQVDEALSAELDDEVDQVAYDLSAWSDADVSLLVERLVDEAVPHTFVEDELLVHEIDEQRVDELVAEVSTPEEGAPAAADANELMGQIFVAADRLRHDPRDHDGTLGLIGALRAAEGAPPPYGMDSVWWEGVLAQAGELVELMEGPDPDDDQVAARADTLRDGLRPYV